MSISLLFESIINCAVGVTCSLHYWNNSPFLDCCPAATRGFLLVYAMVLIMNHPVKNFSNNMDVMTEAATCGASMAINETKDLLESAAAPLMFVIHGVK